MKANAPEKIYIKDFGDKLSFGYYTKQFDGFDIEYIRTDAFIEKAVKYLKDNVTYIHPRKGTKECIVNIPKFIDYMKGE